jgi:hypothetical protein
VFGLSWGGRSYDGVPTRKGNDSFDHDHGLAIGREEDRAVQVVWEGRAEEGRGRCRGWQGAALLSRG